MDIEQLQALIEQGESTSREYKSSTSQLKSGFQTICAFLNNKGGIVLIGVKNDGSIVGQDVTDNTRLEIAREIKKIEPPVQDQVEIHFTPINDRKCVISIVVKGGLHAPYTYDGRAYVRIESTTGTMPQHLYEQLIVRRGQLSHRWEEQIAVGYDIDDLDHEEILRTIKDGIDENRISVEVLKYDITQILGNLKLLKDGKLLNAAIVLFAKEVQPNYSNCMIRLARFRGIDKMADFIDNQRVYGNAFKLLSAANEFALRYLPISSSFVPGNMRRIDQPAVPQLALREALINSISHRDYSNRSATLALAIYDDRLEIWNNGMLPPELDIDALRKPHQSYPRNEDIATIFYKRGWVESWGTGTIRMIGYCSQNGTPEPEFQEYSGGFAVVFPFKEPMGGSADKTLADDRMHNLSPRQKAILKILAINQGISLSEITRQMEDGSTSRAVRRDLAKLQAQGFIELKGWGKKSMWTIVSH